MFKQYDVTQKLLLYFVCKHSFNNMNGYIDNVFIISDKNYFILQHFYLTAKIIQDIIMLQHF